MLKKTVMFARLSDEGILVDLDTGKFYGLNGTGARIVELLAPGARLSGLVHELSREFDLASDTCHREVAEFIDQLRNSNLLGEAESA